MKSYFLLLFSLSLTTTVNCQTDGVQYFYSFDSTKIAYVDQGNGEAIVLIHGFISNGSSWNNTSIYKELLDTGYRVIIPDLRGNGKSDQPKDEKAYSDDAEIKDLIALMDHLKLIDYKAIGYSRGSIVLAKLMTRDKRISKGVLGGMGLDFTNPDWDRRLMFEKAFSGKAPLTEQTKGAVEYAKSIGANTEVLGYLQKYQPVTSIDELQTIEIPVLVIAGDVDTDNGSPQELQKYLPNSKVKIIEGDHNNAYKGEEFAEEILIFLN